MAKDEDSLRKAVSDVVVGRVQIIFFLFGRLRKYHLYLREIMMTSSHVTDQEFFCLRGNDRAGSLFSFQASAGSCQPGHFIILDWVGGGRLDSPP